MYRDTIVLRESHLTKKRLQWPAAAIALLLPALLGLIIIVAYAGLLRAGRWQIDEYQLFLSESRYGLAIFPSRLLFSPRPLSEALIFIYGAAVDQWHKPLVAPFLAALWGCCILAITLAARHAMDARQGRWVASTALSLVIFAFVLVSSKVTEVFYWPVAAAAYIPMLGAAIILFFQLGAPLTPGRKLICCGALCIAAAAHDMGAALAVSFAFCMFLDMVYGRLFRRDLPQGLGGWAWWFGPACIGVGVLATDVIARVPVDVAAQSSQHYTGHFVASLGAGMAGFGLDFITFNEASSWPLILLSLASRSMLAFGAAALLREFVHNGSGVNRRHLALLGALAIAGYFSIAAAYHDYGTFCCERQSTARGGFIDLIFIIAAGILMALMRWQPGRPGGIWIAAALLTLSLAPAVLAIPKLRTEYTMLNWAVTGRDRSWASGSAAGMKSMQFFLPPDSPQGVISGTGIAVGTYRTGPDPEVLVYAIGRYFGKQTVNVCQPWQTNKAWLINNKWIPACPSAGLP